MDATNRTHREMAVVIWLAIFQMEKNRMRCHTQRRCWKIPYFGLSSRTKSLKSARQWPKHRAEVFAGTQLLNETTASLWITANRSSIQLLRLNNETKTTGSQKKSILLHVGASNLCEKVRGFRFFWRIYICAKYRLSGPILWQLPHPAGTLSKQFEDQGQSKINLTNLPQSLCTPVDLCQWWLMHSNVREGSKSTQFVVWSCVRLCKDNSSSE